MPNADGGAPPGTPVVVSDQVNLCEDVRQGGVGAVVPLDVASLAAELGRWMRDEGLRSTAAARAPAFVRERYDWREIARRWGEHYAAIVARTRRDASGGF